MNVRGGASGAWIWAGGRRQPRAYGEFGLVVANHQTLISEVIGAGVCEIAADSDRRAILQLQRFLQRGFPAIPPEVLALIAVPTSLIWGRQDRATPLSVAEAASARFGWPLQVIENCADDPPVEQPDALLRALRTALAS